jgi:drug/metabolite transporter (DMT)-like permease
MAKSQITLLIFATVFRSLLPHFAMFAVALFYSINFFTVKTLFLEMDPFPVLAIRSITGLVFFYLAWKWLAKGEPVAVADRWRLLACGITGISINQIFFLWGLSLTSEFHGAVLMLLTPVFVFLMAHFSGKGGLIRWDRALGLTMSTLGAIWLVKEAAAGGVAGRESLTGDLMILLNAGSYGVYLVLVKPLTSKYKPVTILSYMFMTGGIINIAVGIFFWKDTHIESLSSQAWFGLIFLLIAATLLAYLLNAWAMIRVSPVWVGMYIYLQPVLTMLISAFLFAGSITFGRIGYALLILAGVYLTTRKEKQTPNIQISQD